MKLLADLILNGAETMKMSENIKKNFDNPERNNGELKTDKFKGFITDEWNVDGYVADICCCPVYDGKESHCSI